MSAARRQDMLPAASYLKLKKGYALLNTLKNNLNWLLAFSFLVKI